MMVPSHLAAALVLLASLVAGLEVPVEHSVNGRDWLPAGSIAVDAKDLAGEASQAVLLSRTTSPDAEQQLQQLVEADGLYRIRVPSNLLQPSGGVKVAASIPARCWAADGFKTPLLLELLSDSQVAGVAFDMHCKRGPGSGSSSDAAVGDVSLPEHQYVQLQRPQAAVELRMPLSGAFGGEVPSMPSAGAASGSAQPQGGRGKEGGQEGGKKGPAAKDERTWLQKNWMFVLPAAMLVMNVLGNAAGGGPGGAAGGAAGGGGGGAGRPGAMAVPRR